MSNTTKIAIVTGANKGIGYAIVKGLCEKFGGIVYLTSRDILRGKSAAQKLQKLGLKPSFHQLDITHKISIQTLKNYIIREHGGIDLLINNAAIMYKEDQEELLAKQTEDTINVNYFSTLEVCNILSPILRNNARIVHLSSAAGLLSQIPSPELRKRLSDENLTISELNKLMKEYVESAKNGKNSWGTSAYVASKVGVSILTTIQQREFDKELPFRNISVNCCNPGYVGTDMTGHRGTLTIEEGARSSLFLALEDHKLKGRFVWENNRVVDWTSSIPS